MLSIRGVFEFFMACFMFFFRLRISITAIDRLMSTKMKRGQKAIFYNIENHSFFIFLFFIRLNV